jgi:hypothetical protein
MKRGSLLNFLDGRQIFTRGENGPRASLSTRGPDRVGRGARDAAGVRTVRSVEALHEMGEPREPYFAALTGGAQCNTSRAQWLSCQKIR